MKICPFSILLNNYTSGNLNDFSCLQKFLLEYEKLLRKWLIILQKPLESVKLSKKT